MQKQKFHQHKRPISIKNVDIEKIVVSNKVRFGKKGFKYFIGYKDAKKLNVYIYFFQNWVRETKYVSFLIKDDKLLEKYNEIWKRVTNSLKKEFNNKAIYSQNV